MSLSSGSRSNNSLISLLLLLNRVVTTVAFTLHPSVRSMLLLLLLLLLLLAPAHPPRRIRLRLRLFLVTILSTPPASSSRSSHSHLCNTTAAAAPVLRVLTSNSAVAALEVAITAVDRRAAAIATVTEVCRHHRTRAPSTTPTRGCSTITLRTNILPVQASLCHSTQQKRTATGLR
jgi:hypothetical protein